MPERIKVAEYLQTPIVEIELPDGTVWRVRQPVEADFYRRQELVEQHMARVREHAAKLAERARAVAAESGEEAGRDLIASEADEEALPLEVTLRYLQAALLAIFIEPPTSPDVVLKSLPLDLMHELLARIDEVMVGDAAKKRRRGESL